MEMSASFKKTLMYSGKHLNSVMSLRPIMGVYFKAQKQETWYISEFS